MMLPYGGTPYKESFRERTLRYQEEIDRKNLAKHKDSCAKARSKRRNKNKKK